MVVDVYADGSAEKRKLEAAAQVLNAFTDAKVTVEETWFDFGAEMKWTTLIADCGTGTYQMLYPKLQEDLLNAGLEEFGDWIRSRVIELNDGVLRAKETLKAVEKFRKERMEK